MKNLFMAVLLGSSVQAFTQELSDTLATDEISIGGQIFKVEVPDFILTGKSGGVNGPDGTTSEDISDHEVTISGSSVDSQLTLGKFMKKLTSCFYHHKVRPTMKVYMRVWRTENPDYPITKTTCEAANIRTIYSGFTNPTETEEGVEYPFLYGEVVRVYCRHTIGGLGQRSQGRLGPLGTYFYADRSEMRFSESTNFPETHIKDIRFDMVRPENKFNTLSKSLLFFAASERFMDDGTGRFIEGEKIDNYVLKGAFDSIFPAETDATRFMRNEGTGKMTTVPTNDDAFNTCVTSFTEVETE